jgi:PAS domain S-box-containing protein
LRFALDAASMGTWDWDLTSNSVQWSDNLERIHGLPEGAFDGTFASYEREIHPDDRGRVLASVQRALAEGVPHDVEYRLVAPDGTVRWCEGKGRVEYQEGRPVRMTGVCVMVTRRKEAELARLAAAEESSRLKDEFLATLSHELRTPLSAILGWVHMLEIGGLTPELTARAIDVIGRNARLQAQLVEDVLDVSRIIVGKLDIERTPLALRPLLEGVVAGLAPTLAAKRIQFTSRVPSDLAPVDGDRRRLLQVLNNVFSNAVKFTPEGGSIALECASDQDAVEIRVRDSGIGIEPGFLPLVFDRFRQADSRSTRRHGGLGLGLAIARHLVEQHGGAIRAESAGAGRGTTIVLRLPSAAAPVRGSGPSSGGTEAGGDLRLDGITVLVVDDQPDSREISARLLELRGAMVRQSESAVAALDAIAAEGPDLLIADIAMPDVDGYELIRRVRARGWQMPAIAVTAIARADDRDRALEAGYNAYCAKPVDGVLLARAVRQLVPAAPR